MGAAASSRRRVGVEAAAPSQIQLLERFPTGTMRVKWPAAEVPDDMIAELTGKPVELADELRGKLVLMIGIPGAYTPNCHRSHLPQYLDAYDDFRAAGVDSVVCVTTNDVFCADAWARELGCAGRIRVLSDVNGDVIGRAGLTMDAHATVGRIIVKRFAALLQDGVLLLLFVERDGLGLTCSLAAPLLVSIKSGRYAAMVPEVRTSISVPSAPVAT